MGEPEDQSPRRAFTAALADLACAIGERSLDRSLADWLNATRPSTSDPFRRLAALIETGDREGWLLQREAAGIRFGRPIKPGGEAGRFSVDVVHMDNLAGPHHLHPQGEIGMIVPISGAPRFDQMEAGWYVYPPGSAHQPTVSGGAAYVLYLLPNGAIEFTGH